MCAYRVSLNGLADGNSVYVAVVLTFVSAKHNGLAHGSCS